MTNNSNSVSQYLVLDSLSNGSKYGLEIIEYVSSKSGGNIMMKKPTLYSCLTRMEKKGYISSSFWGESEMGGKRHYYNITSSGKVALEQLAKEFENFSFEEDIAAENEEVPVKDDAIFITERLTENESKNETAEESKTIILQQDNIFDLVKEEKVQEPTSTKEESTPSALDNQIDFFSFQSQQAEKENVTSPEAFNELIESVNLEESPAIEHQNLPQDDSFQEDLEKMEYYQSILEQSPKADDAKFLDEEEKLTPQQEEQNKRLYDTSSELKKYRKRKSFSENQIEMSVVYDTVEDHEIQRSRIEQLKASMLSARDNQYDTFKDHQEQAKTEQKISSPSVSYQNSLKTEDEENNLDDAVFITTPRIEANEIPVQKRILPPNIEIDVTDDNLPAPKRNSSLEPTYKDMMSKLFERKKEVHQKVEQAKQAEPTVAVNEFTDNFVDYDSLKKYYQGHGIEFKEFHKSNVKRNHNTYFLNFISSIALLLLSSIGCAVLFGIIASVNMLNASSKFLFYVVPILFCIYSILTFVRDRVYVSKKAYFKYNSVINWAVFVLATVVVVIANILAGMQYEIMKQYLTSLIVPIFAVMLAFPVNYYIKKFLYKKFAK